MKARTLLVVIAVFGIGVAGILAYDAYQEHERQKMWETPSARVDCGACTAHKADLKSMREYNAQRALLEERADPDVE